MFTFHCQPPILDQAGCLVGVQHMQLGNYDLVTSELDHRKQIWIGPALVSASVVKR